MRAQFLASFPNVKSFLMDSRYGETAGSMSVKEIMQCGVPTVSPDESVNRVMNLMTHHRVRHMPVLRSGKLAGIVSIGDVVKHRLEDLELETNVLRDVYNAADVDGFGRRLIGVPVFADLVPIERPPTRLGLGVHARAHLVTFRELAFLRAGKESSHFALMLVAIAVMAIGILE